MTQSWTIAPLLNHLSISFMFTDQLFIRGNGSKAERNEKIGCMLLRFRSYLFDICQYDKGFEGWQLVNPRCRQENTLEITIIWSMYVRHYILMRCMSAFHHGSNRLPRQNREQKCKSVKRMDKLI